MVERAKTSTESCLQKHIRELVILGDISELVIRGTVLHRLKACAANNDETMFGGRLLIVCDIETAFVAVSGYCIRGFHV